MAAHSPIPANDRQAQSPRRATVLVCDDDRLVLLTLVAALRGAGFEVIEADNGDDAILLARQHRPDIALLDIRMDGKSGLDVASYLRDYVGTPFMFLSAFSDELFIRKAREFGALDYLVKPVDIEKIPPAVAAALARARDAIVPARGGPAPALPGSGGGADGAGEPGGGFGRGGTPEVVPAVASVQAVPLPSSGGTRPGSPMPVAPRAESAGIGGMFAADLPVALATVAQAPAQRPASAGERPDPDGAVPDPAAGEVLRGIALGILMERFRLTREAAGQRLAAIAARSGRGEDEIAEQCVRAIDALNAAGVSDPAG